MLETVYLILLLSRKEKWGYFNVPRLYNKASLLKDLPGTIGILARAKYYKPFFGEYALIRQGVEITHPNMIKTGKQVNINHDTVIRARYGVSIGDYTMISWRCNI